VNEPKRNWNDDWEGLEPEQPQVGSKMIYYAGLGVALLFALTVCGVAAYFVWSQFRERTALEDAPVIALPTTAVSPTNTPLPIAPTSTLPATATAIPLGSGNVEADMFATPPTIDGALTEWNGVASVSSAYRVYSVAGWDGSEDVTAVWQLGWDNDNLYVAVTVTDDTHVQTASGNQIFRGDSVDMQFDTARNADFGDGLSPDDFQITLSPGDFAGSDPTAFRYQGTTGGAILDAPGGNRITVAAQQTSTGYLLEAAIPWTDLSVTPSVGLVIGLALNVNDNDTPGTAVQEVMMSHMPNRTLTNPTTWGTLILK
jgi:Carbohydrate family 9 binding domain-like